MSTSPPFLQEARRRGVLGALGAYVLAAGGTLQLGDVVSHALDLPPWAMKASLVVAALGVPITAVVSWFYDLTRDGFVRTMPPPPRQLPGAKPAVDTVPSAVWVAPAPSAALGPISLEPGGLIAGRYQVEAEIGRGGMGRILSARDVKLGRPVAIKVLTDAFEPHKVQRFEVEARAVAGLLHPNVLGIYDVGDHGGTPFLVCELLHGRTLKKQLTAGPLPPPQALDFARQFARGLGAAHARGVIHRDLKPENLFLCSSGQLKILDFGLAKLAESEAGLQLTPTGSIFGTPGYLSPEQGRGETADARSDVFAFGAVLYEMLCGVRAFPGQTLIEAGVSAITREPAPLPRSIPPPLVDLVRRCLQKDPARRFAHGNELAQALDGLNLGAAPRPARGAAPGPVSAPRTATRTPESQIDPDAIAAKLRAQRYKAMESGVDLDQGDAEDLPFRRCAVCEADSHRAAEVCGSCGAELTTADQQAYNRAYWAKRRADESEGGQEAS